MVSAVAVLAADDGVATVVVEDDRTSPWQPLAERTDVTNHLALGQDRLCLAEIVIRALQVLPGAPYHVWTCYTCLFNLVFVSPCLRSALFSTMAPRTTGRSWSFLLALSLSLSLSPQHRVALV